MTVDCQWVEKNLEALFCDRLSDDEARRARVHIEGCAQCRREVAGLNAIDSLVKGYFRREMTLARRSPVLHKGRIAGLSSAAALVVVVLLLLVIRTPQPSPVLAPPVPIAEKSASAITPAEPAPPVKAGEPAPVLRLRPEPAGPNPDQNRRPQAPPPVTATSPEFFVTDPAGYSHTLDEYRGRVVVLGVWSQGQTESIASMERLYQANATNPKIRFLGISNERLQRPPNTTFPIMYNQGSKLFGATAGEFVLLDENGAVELRGSLTKDAEALGKILRSN
jgi:hypothetical protein